MVQSDREFLNIWVSCGREKPSNASHRCCRARAMASIAFFRFCAKSSFQDRLVTELRLADARTINQATAVLRDFLPRFNARFSVQPEHPEAAYRPVSRELYLSEILCFKHTRKVARDNTVKYHWRILQLLPDPERPSCAGLRVEVLERPDGGLIVQYQGHTVATQEPSPRMGALWAAVSPWSPGPELNASSAAGATTTSASPSNGV